MLICIICFVYVFLKCLCLCPWNVHGKEILVVFPWVLAWGTGQYEGYTWIVRSSMSMNDRFLGLELHNCRSGPFDASSPPCLSCVPVCFTTWPVSSVCPLLMWCWWSGSGVAACSLIQEHSPSPEILFCNLAFWGCSPLSGGFTLMAILRKRQLGKAKGIEPCKELILEIKSLKILR